MMGRWLAALLKAVLAVVLALLLLPFCGTVLADRVGSLGPGPADPLALVLGALLALGLVWSRWPGRLLHTLLHEICHALACRLLGVRVAAISASDGAGGSVVHARVDPLRHGLILIAPYVLPLLPALPLLLRWYWDEPGLARQILAGTAAASLVLHLAGLWRNVLSNARGAGADLLRVGRPLALVLILAAVLLLATWALAVLW